MSIFSRRAPRAFLPGASLCVLASFACAPTPCAAEPAPAYHDLLKQAQNAPLLQAAEARIAQAQGLAQQAGARPNPSIALQVENIAGDGPYRGAGNAEITASIEQTIELGGKRQARIRAGRAGIELARAQARQVQAEFAFAVAEAYGTAEAADIRLQLAKDALDLAQSDARVAQALVTAGKEADLRALQARSAVETARSEVIVAQAGRETALARLTAGLARAVPLTDIPVSLLAHADRSESVAVVDPMTTPAYRVAEAERSEIAYRADIERSRAIPDLTVSTGIRQIRADHARALVGGIALPLPLFDRNRGAVAAAGAELAAADQRVTLARYDAQADIQSASARLRAAFDRVSSARTAEETAQEAYRLSHIGYQAGKLPLSEVLAARRTLIDARLQTLAVRQDRLIAEAELARLAGIIPFGDPQ